MKSEEKQKISLWIQDKCKDMKCECCGKNQFAIVESMVTPMPFTTNTNISLGGGSIPQVLINCVNCGNIKYFSALMIGVMEQPKSKIF